MGCQNTCPSDFKGHVREWHRGHGCELDDGKAKTRSAKRGTADVIVLKDSGEYVVFFIYEQPSGYFALAIESSFGGFAYAWSTPGKDFKAFLAGLSFDYLRGKLVGSDDVFDGEATAKALRKLILDDRWANNISAKEARAAWDAVEEFDSEYDWILWLDSPPRFFRDNFDELYSYRCTAHGRRSTELQGLYERFWPLLKRELEAGGI